MTPVSIILTYYLFYQLVNITARLTCNMCNIILICNDESYVIYIRENVPYLTLKHSGEEVALNGNTLVK